MLAQEVGAAGSQHGAQDDRHDDRVVELPGDRDEVGTRSNGTRVELSDWHGNERVNGARHGFRHGRFASVPSGRARTTAIADEAGASRPRVGLFLLVAERVSAPARRKRPLPREGARCRCTGLIPAQGSVGWKGAVVAPVLLRLVRSLRCALVGGVTAFEQSRPDRAAGRRGRRPAPDQGCAEPGAHQVCSPTTCRVAMFRRFHRLTVAMSSTSAPSCASSKCSAAASQDRVGHLLGPVGDARQRLGQGDRGALELAEVGRVAPGGDGEGSGGRAGALARG